MIALNDIVVRNLQGQPIKYICQCGAQYFPRDGFNGCPWEQIHGVGRCPDRHYGISRLASRVKHRKVRVGQASLRGVDVMGAHWGKYIKLTESFLEE